MNTYLLDMGTYTTQASQEKEVLAQNGFTPEEIPSLLWLRNCYQNGGSDRAVLLRHWEFLLCNESTGRS